MKRGDLASVRPAVEGAQEGGEWGDLSGGPAGRARAERKTSVGGGRGEEAPESGET